MRNLVRQNCSLLFSYYFQIGKGHTFRPVRQGELWQHCPTAEACAVLMVQGGRAEVLLRTATARGTGTRSEAGIVVRRKFALQNYYFTLVF